jgi:HAD superfamily hydrolase (TIGR01509 family)
MGGLIVYDFDGVIAESEVLANSVLAEMVTQLGVPTTLEDSYRLYMGKRLQDVMAAVEQSLGRALPDTFPAQFQARTLYRLRRELQPVGGAIPFIRAFDGVARCIASSSSPDRLAVCLATLGLEADFSERVFSAAVVARGKPFPDIFLYAAKRMGAVPAACIVIEDSACGIEAAAAGMTPIGLLAASHIQPGHGEKLRAAGAQHVAATFAEALPIVRKLLADMA